MTRDDLAFVADALLALCDRSENRPFYSEDAFRLKLRLAVQREPVYARMVSPSQHDPLLMEECRCVIAEARLTERQLDVLSKRLDGWTFEEIGRAGGHSKQGAQNIFLQALKKIARAFRVYPFRGLSEVYRREVRRGARNGSFGKMPLHVYR